jgi:hypothetical protein
MRTAPVNQSAGPLFECCEPLRWISMGIVYWLEVDGDALEV